jgi:hypothetical protein
MNETDGVETCDHLGGVKPEPWGLMLGGQYEEEGFKKET